MKRVYLILIILIVAIAIGAFIGLKMYNKVPEMTDNLKADATMDIDKITSEFISDPAKARKKYSNVKVIVLKGKVNKIVTDPSGQIHLNFSSNNVLVDCQMQDDDKANAKTIAENQEVKLKGKFVGYDDDISPQLNLNYCIIDK